MLVGIDLPERGAGTGVSVQEMARRHGDFAMVAACRVGDASTATCASRSSTSPTARCGPAKPRPPCDRTACRSHEVADARRARPRSPVRPARHCRIPAQGRRSARAASPDRSNRTSEERGVTDTIPISAHGQRRRPRRRRRGPQDPRRLPPRGPRAHRHASRLRARRVRRVHGAPRRRARAFVPDARRAGRGASVTTIEGLASGGRHERTAGGAA